LDHAVAADVLPAIVVCAIATETPGPPRRRRTVRERPERRGKRTGEGAVDHRKARVWAIRTSLRRDRRDIEEVGDS